MPPLVFPAAGPGGADLRAELLVADGGGGPRGARFELSSALLPNFRGPPDAVWDRLAAIAASFCSSASRFACFSSALRALYKQCINGETTEKIKECMYI
jgi:hypothetical protein